MQSIALLSGLIGALISAGFSFWIRATLDRRNLKEAETRIAYVHFVKISEIIAIEIVAKSYINAFLSDELKSKDGSFEASHAISVLIAQEVRKLTPEKLKATSGISFVSVYLKSQLESISEWKLSAEQLSKLPKETVLNYSLFLNYVTHLQSVVLIWSTVCEELDTSWVTPETIHNQWIALTKFFEHARTLRTTLLRAGAVSTTDASNLLQKQVSTYNESIAAKFQHSHKLKAALADKAAFDAKSA